MSVKSQLDVFRMLTLLYSILALKMENWNQVILASGVRGTGNELRQVSEFKHDT